MRFAAFALASLSAVSQAWGADPSLTAVFQRMDKAAAEFKGIKADIKRVTHQDIINEDTVETGTLAFRKPRKGDVQYLLKLNQVDPPLKEVVALNNDRLDIYHPSINTVQSGKLSAQLKNKAEQFLALGFGTSSNDLQSNYTVTLGGQETIEGQKTTRLDLVPKSQEVLQMYRKISMWVSDATGVAVQLKLIEPGLRDYGIATYTNMKFGDVSDTDVKLELPKGVKHDVFH